MLILLPGVSCGFATTVAKPLALYAAAVHKFERRAAGRTGRVLALFANSCLDAFDEYVNCASLGFAIRPLHGRVSDVRRMPAESLEARHAIARVRGGAAPTQVRLLKRGLPRRFTALHSSSYTDVDHLTSVRLNLWRTPCRMWSTVTCLHFSSTR